jgi:large subunit ribosomal protein L47
MRRRQTLSVKGEALPKPVKIETKVTGTDDHGLWGFFKNKELLQTPVAEQRHGRSWTLGELRNRDWDELHQLWWVCVKERNRLATEKIELNRLNAGYGEFEAQERDKTVQETMKAILDTLAERQTAYLEAFELAKNDPTIDLTRTDGPQYIQTPYVRLASCCHSRCKLTTSIGPVRGRRAGCRGAAQRKISVIIRSAAKGHGELCVSVVTFDSSVIHRV